MLLGLLLSLLSATFTVGSSKTIEVSGEMPESAHAVFTRTAESGDKKRMTAGNATELCILGFDKCVIKSVTLKMRSNKAQGAGSLRMSIGKQVVWEIADADFANSSWYGAWSTEWVEISKSLGQTVGVGDSITIRIEASKNSLYIQRYTIEYEAAQKEAYSVYLQSGLTEEPLVLKEDSPSAGVVLPMCIDTLEWYFKGWCEHAIEDSTACPTLWAGGTRYYPRSDCQLWALYSDVDKVVQTTDYQSGEYVIAHNVWGHAMYGDVHLPDVENARYRVVGATPVVLADNTGGGKVLVSEVDEEMVYAVQFLSDSTLTIRNVVSDGGVGFKTNQLADQELEWSYKSLPDSSLAVYHIEGDKAYLLTFGYGPNAVYDEIVAYAQSINLATVVKNALWFFPVSEARFTSFPLGKLSAVEQVSIPYSTEQDVRICWGVYEIHVVGGKKYVRLLK